MEAWVGDGVGELLDVGEVGGLFFAEGWWAAEERGDFVGEERAHLPLFGFEPVLAGGPFAGDGDEGVGGEGFGVGVDGGIAPDPERAMFFGVGDFEFEEFATGLGGFDGGGFDLDECFGLGGGTGGGLFDFAQAQSIHVFPHTGLLPHGQPGRAVRGGECGAIGRNAGRMSGVGIRDDDAED